MAEKIYLTHSTTGVSGTSALGPPVSFTGTISEVRVLLPVGNLSGETQTFDLYKNGVALATGLEVPDGDNEDTVTGLSEAATDDDTFQFYITAPVASTLPVPPYHFTITLAETHVALTGNQTVAGVKTFSSSPIVPTPSGSTDAANKAYVDSSVAGLSWKQAVRAATTAAGTLASDFENGDTVDGVTLATGDRILIKNQADQTANGIYIVAASGAPTRATDADTAAEILQASVYVQEGTTNADTQWVNTTNAPITLGATNIVFTQLTSGGASALNDLSDVVITAAASGEFIRHNGTNWVDDVIAAGDLPTGIDAAKIADGSVSNTEFQYIGGLTSDAQTQLNAKAVEAFKTISVSGQSDVVADTNADTLTLAAGANITITTNAGTDTVTIAASGGGGGGTFNIDDGDAATNGNFTFDDGDASTP